MKKTKDSDTNQQFLISKNKFDRKEFDNVVIGAIKLSVELVDAGVKVVDAINVAFEDIKEYYEQNELPYNFEKIRKNFEEKMHEVFLEQKEVELDKEKKLLDVSNFTVADTPKMNSNQKVTNQNNIKTVDFLGILNDIKLSTSSSTFMKRKTDLLITFLGISLIFGIVVGFIDKKVTYYITLFEKQGVYKKSEIPKVKYDDYVSGNNPKYLNSLSVEETFNTKSACIFSIFCFAVCLTAIGSSNKKVGAKSST